MIGQTLSHYRVLEQIGAGGMGLVFRAHDERLGRDVALKVLPLGTLTDENARKRFRKEALTLSKLNHPNIETVFDFDTQDGVDFLVMELIPGVTLDEKLAAGALPEKEVVRLGTQLTEGLAAAHAEGVVHRDLKPGNLRLTPDGRLKILDFGLAKLLRPVSDAAVTESLSQTRGAVGTLPYMAPEQLQGEAADARSDIWAAGAVLYEMAAGRRPFPQTSSPMLTDAILRQAPVPPRAVNANLSPELERILTKSLEKDPENRYQSAKELGVDLRRLGTPLARVVSVGAPKPAWQSQVRYVIPVAGMAAILMVASAFVWNIEGFQDRLLGRASAPSAPRIQSLAVLPLQNLSGDLQQEYFADGMTEELTTEVARIGALRVISRTSVMQYKGVHRPLPEIARELNVDAVVEGSVLRSGDRVRITAQLIRAATDEHLWAESYDRDLRDVLGLQREVARDIAQEVRVKLTPQEERRLASRLPVNPEVHDVYLQGRYHFNKGTERELKTAIEYFERAIAREPSYALAYAGLADCYGALATDYAPPREVMPKAKAAALKALELDETLSEVHMSLGRVYYFYDWDWAATEREAKRAIELNPNNADAHDLYGMYLVTLGRSEQAMTEFERAHELDPLSAGILADKVLWTWAGRRYDLAIENGRKAIQTEPSFAPSHAALALAYAQTGHFAEAIVEADTAHRLDDSPLTASMRANVYALAGRRTEAERALGEIREEMKRRYSCSYEVATVYVLLGQKDRAFEWFQKAYDARSDCMVLLKMDPRLDSIRSDPRYQELVRRVGFPP
jgi:TolB-like protein/Flp pilus assembly protein TadD